MEKKKVKYSKRERIIIDAFLIKLKQQEAEISFLKAHVEVLQKGFASLKKVTPI